MMQHIPLGKHGKGRELERLEMHLRLAFMQQRFLIRSRVVQSAITMKRSGRNYISLKILELRTKRL